MQSVLRGTEISNSRGLRFGTARAKSRKAHLGQTTDTRTAGRHPARQSEAAAQRPRRQRRRDASPDQLAILGLGSACLPCTDSDRVQTREATQKAQGWT